MGRLVDGAEARRGRDVPGEAIEGHHRGGVLVQALDGADGEGCGAKEGHLEHLHVEAHVETVVGVSAGQEIQKFVSGLSNVFS